MSIVADASFITVLPDIGRERLRQIAKWGPQHHVDGTGALKYKTLRAVYTRINDDRPPEDAEWDDILLEEVYEALSERDVAKLRAELIQVAAVCAAWVEDLDAR